MTDFGRILTEQAPLVAEIHREAWALHESVGQTYDDTHPYGFHLSMVAEAAMKHGAAVVADGDDALPLVFGAYFHDSIEDARLTYNDVMRTARRYMSDAQALTATEIVYALTNEKGRTRAERAGEKYYAGIRATPYAPLVKLCDRWANMSYSLRGTNETNNHMREVYRQEWPHFIEAIDAHSTDVRLQLPRELVKDIEQLLEAGR